MPDVIRISLTFAVILILLRRKLNVGYVMMIASAVLFIFYRMGPGQVAETVRRTATSDVTAKLLLALSFIRMFELVLRERDVLSAMMSAVKTSFKSRRAVIISMPMLIGMLPSLGGAYFSAPMVKEATEGLKMSQEEKAFINYWFRHPWEYVLPLYPGILLAAAISKIPLYTLMAANLTYSVVLFLTGFIFSMRGMGERPRKASGTRPGIDLRGMLNFLPLAVVLFLVIALRIELQYALLGVIAVLFCYYRYSMREIVRVTLHGFALDVIVLITGTMLFKETMEYSGAVRNLSAFFVGRGIPVLPILCLLPFVTGLLTGLTVGFVGSTFPLLISIAGGASLPYMTLAFAFGFLGVLLSPVHLCLVLTREYFKADLWGVYRKMLPACLFILVSAVLEYTILRAVGP